VSFGRFGAIVGGGAAASLTLVFSVVTNRGVRGAIVLGALLAVLNALAAYALARWSLGRSGNVFLKAVLGSMVGRLAFVLAAMAIAMQGFGVPSMPLAVSVLAYSIVFLCLELAVLHRTLGSPRAVAR
jgi:hypothetical protein